MSIKAYMDEFFYSVGVFFALDLAGLAGREEGLREITVFPAGKVVSLTAGGQGLKTGTNRIAIGIGIAIRK